MLSVKKLWGVFFDFLFPNDEKALKIELMGAEGFRNKAPRANLDVSPYFQNAYSLFQYRNATVKEAIWQLKYRGNKKIAHILAELLYEEIIADLEDKTLFENFEFPLVIPIPISKKRLRRRGYNQMELLGYELESLNKNEAFEFSPNVLKKIKETIPQTMIKDRRFRLRNLKGCFEVKDTYRIKNRNIILIDDVLTTGSTIEEARNTLIKAGAKKVIVFTLAH